MKKAISVLSGGLDCVVATCVYAKDYDVHAITFNYGQKSFEQELKASKEICEKMGFDHRLAQGPDVRPRQEQAVGQVPPGAGDTQGARGRARIDDQDGVGADAAQVAHVPQDAGRGLPGRVEHNDRRRLERGRRGRAHIGHPQRPALGPQIGRRLLKIGQERALGEEVDAVPGDEDDLGVLVLKVADPGIWCAGGSVARL